MRNRTFRRIFAGVWLAALLLAATCAQALSGTEIIVLRIGKADAIVVRCGAYTLLIDAGEEEDAAEILEFLAERRIPALDAMIITHYDKDHVGGADGVLDGIAVGVVYDAHYESGSKQYEEYLQALAQSGVRRVRVMEPMEVAFGDAVLHLLPTALQTDSDNDNSVVISMSDGMHTYLFAADAEEARIAELIADGIGPHDFLKMPHHGRYNGQLAALLDAVQPSVAVITDSKKNPADGETLALLAERDIPVWRTVDGNIHITGGRSGLSVSQ